MADNFGIKNLRERIAAPTPGFFKKARRAMIVIGLAGGAILAAPAALPAAIITAAGYMIAIGAVGTALSSLPKEENTKGG